MGERFMAMLALERPAHVTAKAGGGQVRRRSLVNTIPASLCGPDGSPEVIERTLRRKFRITRPVVGAIYAVPSAKGNLPVIDGVAA